MSPCTSWQYHLHCRGCKPCILTFLSIVSKQSTPPQEISSDADSDIDDYGPVPTRARANKKLQPRRLLHDTSRDPTPNHSELRFPTRKAAKTTNYNEDDDDPFEDEEDVANQTKWITDTTPGIDIVLEHVLRDDLGK